MDGRFCPSIWRNNESDIMLERAKTKNPRTREIFSISYFYMNISVSMHHSVFFVFFLSVGNKIHQYEPDSQPFTLILVFCHGIGAYFKKKLTSPVIVWWRSPINACRWRWFRIYTWSKIVAKYWPDLSCSIETRFRSQKRRNCMYFWLTVVVDKSFSCIFSKLRTDHSCF